MPKKKPKNYILTNTRVERVLAFDFGEYAGWGCVDREGALVGAGKWYAYRKGLSPDAKTGRKTMSDVESGHRGKYLARHELFINDALTRKRPTHIVYSRSVNSQHVLPVKYHGEFRALLYLAAWRNGLCPIPVYEVSEGQVKTSATGKGVATKHQMIDAAIARWGDLFKQDNETAEMSDAAWCAETGRVMLLRGEVII